MKKWKKALSAIVVAAVMGFGMASAGCGGKKDHTEHTWSGWKTTTEGHYKETTCKEHDPIKGSEGKHVDSDGNGKCDVCEYTMTPATQKVTVTFNSLGGSSVASQEIDKGGKATLPTAPTKEGYDFGGWYEDEACTKAFDFDTALNDNKTLFAKWTAKTPAVQKITVTFNSLGGSAVTSQEIEKGGKATLPTAPTKDGHVFGGWYEDEACTQAFDFNTVLNDNKTLFAKWTQVSGTVIDASDLESVTAGVALKEGVGIKPAGSVELDSNPNKTSTFAGATISPTKRIKLTGSYSSASLEVNLDKAATILVYAYSGASNTERNLALYDSEKKIVADTTQCIGDGNNNILCVALFEVAANTTYHIGSLSGGINIYYIAVLDSFVEKVAQTVDAKAATCEEDGNIAYKLTDYGRYLKSDGTAVPYNQTKTAKLGHAYKVSGTVTPATATETGSAKLVCDNDSKHAVDVTLPLLTSTEYKSRPQTGNGEYVYEYLGVEIKFNADAVEEKQDTYTPVLELPNFNGVTVGSSATEGQNSVYCTEGSAAVQSDGSLKIGSSSSATKAFLKLGTPITEGVVKISGSIKVESTNGNWTFFQLYNTQDFEVVGFRTGSGGVWGHRLGGAGDAVSTPIAKDTSKIHTFEIIVDLSSKTVSITVDETTLADKVTYSGTNELDGLSAIAFANINSGRFVSLYSLTVATKD